MRNTKASQWKTCYFYFTHECTDKKDCKYCIFYHPYIVGIIDRQTFNQGYKMRCFTDVALTQLLNKALKRKLL